MWMQACAVRSVHSSGKDVYIEMKKRLLLSIVLLIALAGAALAQKTFDSAEAGFRIDLPGEGITVTDTTETERGIGVGKKYSWLTMDDRVFMITVYDTTVEGKALDATMQQTVLNGFADGFLRSAKKNKYPLTTKPFVYGGHKGTEYRIAMPRAVSITRVFTTPTRFYMLQTTVKGRVRATESSALKTLGTFKTLTTK